MHPLTISRKFKAGMWGEHAARIYNVADILNKISRGLPRDSCRIFGV